MEKVKKTLSAIFYCFTKITKNNWPYKVVALIGLILRVWLLPILIPDIFEIVADWAISQLALPQWAYEILIRVCIAIVDLLALGSIFHYLTFACVGCFYEEKTEPVFGSISYTIFYFIHMFIPIILIQNFNWFAIIMTFLVYAIICTIFYIIASKIDSLSSNWAGSLVIHSIIFVIIFTIVILLKVYCF